MGIATIILCIFCVLNTVVFFMFKRRVWRLESGLGLICLYLITLDSFLLGTELASTLGLAIAVLGCIVALIYLGLTIKHATQINNSNHT